MNAVKITIVYDNYVYSEGLLPGWGFAALIEKDDERILFDTGADRMILDRNLQALNIDPAGFTKLVISHDHCDHTGAISYIWFFAKDIKTYIVASATQVFEKAIQKDAEIVKVDKPLKIAEGIHSTGELGSAIKEQSLVLETSEGLVVLTGCAHPGINETIEFVRKEFSSEIYAVFGGFHLLDKSQDELRKISNHLKDFGLKQIGCSHCSGDSAREIFKKELNEKYIEIGVGRTLEY